MSDSDDTRPGDLSNREELIDWEGAPDLTAISEDELRGWLKSLAEEERDISYRRRVIQGRIDLLRAELVRRGAATLSPEELVRVLMDGAPRAEDLEGGRS
jgi:hypothetical protein